MEPMRASRKLTTDLTIRDDLSGLAVLRDNLDRIGTELGVPDKPLVQLQVALDEIASNVIKYGWPDSGNHELRVRITGYHDRVEVEIVDDGQEFDPRLAPRPEPPRVGRGRTPGGVGIHLVKQLVDRIEYERIGGRNRTVMTKRYARQRAPDRRTLL
jgi:anti-sigma regulatory factor (Ser/Thr protein kinase)